MKCPFCGFDDTAVKDSRQSDDGIAIKRRRYCAACSSRFTTVERIHLRDFVVLKNDQTRQAFDRDKLFRSIFLALRKRPFQTEHIERIVSSIVRQLEVLGETEIPSSLIGEHVMQALKDVDPVAYIRFASVYMDFAQVIDFEKFLEKVAQN